MDRLDLHTDNTCMNCGEAVTQKFTKTHGDRHGRIHRCHNCDTGGRIRQGSAAGIQVDDPDPMNHPGRKNNMPDYLGGDA